MLSRSIRAASRGVVSVGGAQPSRGMANRGWMNGSAPHDELAGRRETTYKDWEWNNTTLFDVGAKFILPIIVFGSMICSGFDERRERQGRMPPKVEA